MGDPLVTIIVATYERTMLLEAAVRSALEQTLSEVEIILVGDGATADTRATCSRLSEDFPEVSFVQQERAGQAVARQHGLTLAHGRWVAFLDDDDLWSRRFLEETLHLANSRGTPVAASQAVYFWSDSEEIRGDDILHDPSIPWRPFAEPQPELVEVPELILRPLVAAHAGLFRRDFLMDLGGYPCQLPAAADYLLWLRVADRIPVPVHPEILAFHRRHSGQMSSLVGSQAHQTRRVLEIFLEEKRKDGFPIRGPLVRHRLATLFREETYVALLEGDGQRTRRLASNGLRLWPLDLKLWAYFVLGFRPRFYPLVRRLLFRESKAPAVR